MQNQPVLYVREGVDGKDRVLVDANQLAADGTIALDWYQASENGKYLAYGTSPSGSEMSTLQLSKLRRALRCPTRLSARALAALHGCWTTRDFITRDIRRGATCGRAGDVQPARVLSDLGTDPETDTKVFGEGRDPEDWPGVKPGQ